MSRDIERSKLPFKSTPERTSKPPSKTSDPFTEYAGQTVIPGAPKDEHGNPEGTEFDLAKDDAFDGMKVVVLQFYTGEGFDFEKPRAALEQKGFTVVRHTSAPNPDALAAELADASQLWVISGERSNLSELHISLIRDFFDDGKGVYIWGDNDPYYVDANLVGQALLGSTMHGNSPGNKVLHEANYGGSGFVQHQITTGLEFLYEGHTIAAIEDPSERLVPIMRGSDGHIVTACFDRDGKRALIDGGFTRLYVNWDDAGTARFVKNAAAWLVNWGSRKGKQKWMPGSHPD